MTGIVTEEDDDGNAASPPQHKVQIYTASKQTAQAKIAELRQEMQEPARQDGMSGTEQSVLPPPASHDAAAPFIWKMGKWKDTHIADLPLDYLVWACTNISRADHKQAALDEIDRRQKQDHMNFETQG